MKRAFVLTVALLGLAASLLAAQVGREPAPPAPVNPGTVSPVKMKKAKPAAAAAFDESLPMLGTQLSELPPGPGKATADAACLRCHSADILRQQRLNEKQWTANVTKMAGWGAEIPEADKRDELLAYLVKNFGPDNDRFKPVVTRPAGR